MSRLTALRENLLRRNAAGQTSPIGEPASASARLARLAAHAVTGGGYFDVHPDNFALARFRCGESDALLCALLAGNAKDSRCAYASGAAALALIDAFDQGLISSADIVPTIRRAIISSDDAIRALTEETLESPCPNFFDANATHLRGIGCCVVVVVVCAGNAWCALVGDGTAYMIREGKPRKLVLEQTLHASIPASQRGVEFDVDFAKNVTLQALGFGNARPLLTQVALRPGDRIVITGNVHSPSADPWPLLAQLPTEGSEAIERLAQTAQTQRACLPETFAVIDYEP